MEQIIGQIVGETFPYAISWIITKMSSFGPEELRATPDSGAGAVSLKLFLVSILLNGITAMLLLLIAIVGFLFLGLFFPRESVGVTETMALIFSIPFAVFGILLSIALLGGIVFGIYGLFEPLWKKPLGLRGFFFSVLGILLNGGLLLFDGFAFLLLWGLFEGLQGH